MGVDRLEWRAEMSPALTLSPRNLWSVLVSLRHQKHTCSQQGWAYYLLQQRLHTGGSLGCLQRGQLKKSAHGIVGGWSSKDSSVAEIEFTEQGVTGTVSNPVLRIQESSRSVTIRSICLWFSLGTCESQSIGVYKCELR